MVNLPPPEIPKFLSVFFKKNIVARPIVLQKALVRSRFRCLPSTVETVSSAERARDQAPIDQPFILDT